MTNILGQTVQRLDEHIQINIIITKKKIRKIIKQAQRRAAAETASRKLIEHFIHLMHNSSRIIIVVYTMLLN